ncbi:MAG: 30S ribosomal protein S7 [Candidatus Sericytochromatia bacterium]|uniref:Small ribosomal subunit protein uS7 n=1 Tax=Candidatus Tanganyikabacteria bacterium TaxID=2961651 RepID=A0A937X2D6_9BACT|nr:30S ribosomal protein S7 [Candidatus Tanganyikabacteria bacterium]
MPRRGVTKKRVREADSVLHSPVATRFINCLMERGKKSLAERIFYGAVNHVAEKVGKEPREVFDKALKNATPLLEVKPRRVGGATYQVPVEVKTDRGVALATRWIITNARKRSGKPMVEKLALELLETYNNGGPSVKKKEDTHKMAEANKAFAHYRW